jgi:hypothetical protein
MASRRLVPARRRARVSVVTEGVRRRKLIRGKFSANRRRRPRARHRWRKRQNLY